MQKLKIDFFKCFEKNKSNLSLEKDIKVFEKEIGLEFPKSYYLEFLLNTNGGDFNPFLKKGNDKINLEIEPILKNKYHPKIHDITSEAFIGTFFNIDDIYEYVLILKENELYDYQYEIINNNYKLIPIGLDGSTGIFYIAANGTERSGNIYFYDYSIDDSEDGDSPETFIDLICNSFEEYINSFYYLVEE